MYDVFIYFREDGDLYSYVTNVTKITYERGFFRIHVDATRPQDDFFVRASVFTLQCLQIEHETS